MPSADKEVTSIEPWAAGIGLGTLVLVTIVALFTAWDHAHTASLEDVITPTAVGDVHFVKPPAAGAGPIGLKYEGAQLDFVAQSKIRDAKLIRVGTDDSGVYSLYRMEEAKEAKDERLFVKAADNNFIEVRQE